MAEEMDISPGEQIIIKLYNDTEAMIQKGMCNEVLSNNFWYNDTEGY